MHAKNLIRSSYHKKGQLIPSKPIALPKLHPHLPANDFWAKAPTKIIVPSGNVAHLQQGLLLTVTETATPHLQRTSGIRAWCRRWISSQSNFAVAAKVGKVPQSRHQKPPPSAGSNLIVSAHRTLNLSLAGERALFPLCTFQLFLMGQQIG